MCCWPSPFRDSRRPRSHTQRHKARCRRGLGRSAQTGTLPAASCPGRPIRPKQKPAPALQLHGRPSLAQGSSADRRSIGHRAARLNSITPARQTPLPTHASDGRPRSTEPPRRTPRRQGGSVIQGRAPPLCLVAWPARQGSLPRRSIVPRIRHAAPNLGISRLASPRLGTEGCLIPQRRGSVPRRPSADRPRRQRCRGRICHSSGRVPDTSRPGLTMDVLRTAPHLSHCSTLSAAPVVTCISSRSQTCCGHSFSVMGARYPTRPPASEAVTLRGSRSLRYQNRPARYARSGRFCRSV